jgi:hypothetical protein
VNTLLSDDYVEVRLKAEKHWQIEALVVQAAKGPSMTERPVECWGNKLQFMPQKSLTPGSSDWRKRKRFVSMPITSPSLQVVTSAECRQVEIHAGAKPGNVFGILPKVLSSESDRDWANI